MKRFVLLMAGLLVAGGVLAAGADVGSYAKAVRSGELDSTLGKTFSMDFQNGRFHRIHAMGLGLPCTNCHVGPAFAQDALFLRKHEVPKGAPGVVDRTTCMGCHHSGGAADAWYGDAATK